MCVDRDEYTRCQICGHIEGEEDRLLNFEELPSLWMVEHTNVDVETLRGYRYKCLHRYEVMDDDIDSEYKVFKVNEHGDEEEEIGMVTIWWDLTENELIGTLVKETYAYENESKAEEDVNEAGLFTDITCKECGHIFCTCKLKCKKCGHIFCRCEK